MTAFDGQLTKIEAVVADDPSLLDIRVEYYSTISPDGTFFVEAGVSPDAMRDIINSKLNEAGEGTVDAI